MGDEKAKPKGKAKKPKKPQVDGAPKELDDFLDCKSMSITLEPGKLDWIPKKGIFEYSPTPSVEYAPGKAEGTVDLKISLGLSTTVTAKVNADGQLEVDTSNSRLLNAEPAKSGIDKFTKDFNDWLKHNNRKLGKPTVKDGNLVLTKEITTAMGAAPAGGVKSGGLFPNVPTSEKVGAGAFVALATVAAVAFMPSSETTTRPIAAPVAAAASEPTAPPSTTTTVAGITTAPPDTSDAPTVVTVLADGCVEVRHGQGASTIYVHFTADPDLDGPWLAELNGPLGPEPGTGALTGGQGQVAVPITQYGTRDSLTLNPQGGAPFDLGPLANSLPFTVGPSEVSCDASALVPLVRVDAPATPPTPVPAAATTAPPAEAGSDGDDAQGASAPTATRMEATGMEQVTTDPKPWSLLLIPGSIAVAGGGLALDEQRRRRRNAVMPW